MTALLNVGDVMQTLLTSCLETSGILRCSGIKAGGFGWQSSKATSSSRKKKQKQQISLQRKQAAN